ncbi:MAG TPA: diguanylate cyclase [Myxococcota bacterium]|nr:diguanylate cyclase [Myxococcota bacterium]
MSGISILVIDDDAAIRRAVEARLEGVVDRVITAETPTKGLQIAIQEKPDAILLDINMPQIDGFKVCRHLQENPATHDIPILFLTGDHNSENLAKALDAGASDYISKPFNAVELEARVRVALRTKRMIDLLRERARIDALTGLHNRAAMDDALTAATAAFQRTGQSVALLMIDLDHFKEINDTYGHGVGDDVIRRVGASIRGGCRPYDLACRFGGDEFGVILGQAEGSSAEQIARRILSGIAQIRIRAGGDEIEIGCSGGIVSATQMPAGFAPADLLKAADAALYRSKSEGRNRLSVAASAT